MGDLDVELFPQQTIAFHSPANEILFGGSKGPGKSTLLRIASILLCCQAPGLQAFLFRRTYPDLQKNHMEGSNSYPELLARMVKKGLVSITPHVIKFRFNGSRIFLNHLQYAKDVTKYQGQEIHLLLMDELTQFCVHPDTEVMTKTGWKPISIIKPGDDQVASIDHEFEMTWQPVTRLWRFDYDGDLIQVNQRSGVRMAVTPNHKVLLNAQKHNHWEFRRADQLPKFPDFVYGGRYKGTPKRIKRFGPITGRGIGTNQNSITSIAMDDWLEFLGWFLSEGSAFGGDKSPRVSIRQTKENASLNALMERLPWRTMKIDGGYLIYSRQLFNELKPLGNVYQKRVPQYVFDCSGHQIDRLLASFTAGDGSINEHGGIGIGLANELLRDDIARLFVLTGYKVTCGFSRNKGRGAWIISAGKRSRYSVQSRPEYITRSYYKGDVWCLTVEPHHNFVARYRGRIFVTGNTEEQYRYLFGSVRLGSWVPPAHMKDVFPRILCGANPGGVSHTFVKKRFVDQGPYIVTHQGGMRRQFIPARAEDNPALLTNDPLYLERLEEMGDAALVKAMRDGDWTVVAGAMFGDAWRATKYGRPWHVHPGFLIPNSWKLWRGADDGYSDPFAGYWGTQDPKYGTIYVIDELYGSGMLPDTVAERVLTRDSQIPLAEFNGKEWVPCGFNQQQLSGAIDNSAFTDPGQSDKKGEKAITRGEQMNRKGCKWRPVQKWPGSRVAGVQNFHRLLAPNPKAPLLRNDKGEVTLDENGKALHDRPGIVFFKRCVNAIEHIPTLPRSKQDPEDIDDVDFDHSFAGVRYLIQYQRGETKIVGVSI